MRFCTLFFMRFRNISKCVFVVIECAFVELRALKGAIVEI